MGFASSALEEGGTYEVKVDAKNPKGEGIGHVNDVVVFIRNAKARADSELRIAL